MNKTLIRYAREVRINGVVGIEVSDYLALVHREMCIKCNCN